MPWEWTLVAAALDAESNMEKSCNQFSEAPTNRGWDKNFARHLKSGPRYEASWRRQFELKYDTGSLKAGVTLFAFIKQTQWSNQKQGFGHRVVEGEGDAFATA
jgi:hypothetical protein